MTSAATEYALYLESGPKRRKTMVHVLTLPGCIAQGTTTEAALEVTPGAIRNYLRFLRRHGEPVNPDGPIATTIAAHVMEGHWLGNGDPTPGFEPDFAPLTADELALRLRNLGWMRAEMLQLVGELPPERLSAGPDGAGRPIRGIIEHVVEADATYLRYITGKVEGLSDAVHAVERGPVALEPALTHLWQVSSARMATLTEEERSNPIPHGQVTWTARRGMRRMLEHQWEHLQELRDRLDAGL